MARYRHLILADGGPLADTMPPITSERRLLGFTAHFSAAPTTSEYFTVTLDSVDGSQYDTVLYKVDPAASVTTDIVWTDANLPLLIGDTVTITYANSNHRTIGVRIVLE